MAIQNIFDSVLVLEKMLKEKKDVFEMKNEKQ